jgi:hypothetical protein
MPTQEFALAADPGGRQRREAWSSTIATAKPEMSGAVRFTSPLPKKPSEYQLPEGTSLDDAQALLSRKLEEARVIIRDTDAVWWWLWLKQ